MSIVFFWWFFSFVITSSLFFSLAVGAVSVGIRLIHPLKASILSAHGAVALLALFDFVLLDTLGTYTTAIIQLQPVVSIGTVCLCPTTFTIDGMIANTIVAVLGLAEFGDVLDLDVLSTVVA